MQGAAVRGGLTAPELLSRTTTARPDGVEQPARLRRALAGQGRPLCYMSF